MFEQTEHDRRNAGAVDAPSRLCSDASITATSILYLFKSLLLQSSNCLHLALLANLVLNCRSLIITVASPQYSLLQDTPTRTCVYWIDSLTRRATDNGTRHSSTSDSRLVFNGPTFIFGLQYPHVQLTAHSYSTVPGARDGSPVPAIVASLQRRVRPKAYLHLYVHCVTALLLRGTS